MISLKSIIPKYFEESVYCIDFKKYYDKGYRFIIFDIDNTLVEDEEPIDKRCKEKLLEIENMGFNLSILSNNEEKRVKEFVKGTNIKNYVCLAKKPRRDGYEKLISKIGAKREEVLYIGDQLFTDILGANNAGVDVILVEQISYDKHFYIRIKRFFEIIIKKLYLDKVKNKYANRKETC